MNLIDAFLNQLGCGKSGNARYVRNYLEIVLELHSIPKNIYTLTAERSGVRLDALRQGFSRIIPPLWAAGSGIFHKPGTPCPKPKDALEKVAFYLSGGKIL